MPGLLKLLVCGVLDRTKSLLQLGPDQALGIAALKPGDDQLFIDTPAGTTAAGIRVLVTEAYSLVPGSSTAHVPCQPILDLVVKGQFVGGVLGVLPRSLSACKAVFVDPGTIGRPIAFLALPPFAFTITGVLGLIGSERPPALTFAIRGAPMVMGHAEAFLPQNDTVVILDVDPLLGTSAVPDAVADARSREPLASDALQNDVPGARRHGPPRPTIPPGEGSSPSGPGHPSGPHTPVEEQTAPPSMQFLLLIRGLCLVTMLAALNGRWYCR